MKVEPKLFPNRLDEGESETGDKDDHRALKLPSTEMLQWFYNTCLIFITFFDVSSREGT